MECPWATLRIFSLSFWRSISGSDFLIKFIKKGPFPFELAIGNELGLDFHDAASVWHLHV